MRLLKGTDAVKRTTMFRAYLLLPIREFKKKSPTRTVDANLQQHTTIEQLRCDLNDYVWWFNNQRLHSTLGYWSPKEFTERGLIF